MAVVTDIRTGTSPTDATTNPATTRPEAKPTAALAWLLAQALIGAPLFP